MGSCSSGPNQPTDVGPGDQQNAPMWVVQVRHVLEMTGKLQAHESLKDQNLLEIWRPKMFTLFVSHQWLGLQHPDPNGEQLKVLVLVLKKLIHRRLRIEHDFVSQFFGRKLAAKQLDRVGDWYMWLDYFSVPQHVHEVDGLEHQMYYVKNIPSYVDACNAFVALVPQAVHHDAGVACDVHSWLQRGWCRTELWCYYLSTRLKVPIIEVKSPDAVRFTVPLWHRYPVHLGDFGIAKDRASCSLVMQNTLTRYIGELRETNKTSYRLYLSLFEEITGLPRKLRSLEEFTSEFDFPKPLKQYKGLGPAACAALSGDEELLRRVTVAKASLHTAGPAMPETLNCPDQTPLHYALWFRSHDVRVLETLLELRANPNSSTMNVPPPLGLCRTVEAVDLLVRNNAGVNFQGKLMMQTRPIHGAAFFGAPPQVSARLLELRADLHGGKGGIASASPLHSLAYSGDSKNSLSQAQLLIESRADVNQVVRPEGFVRLLELMCRSYSCCRNDTSLVVRYLTHLSTTPLGWCVLLDNHGLLVLLLRARADPEIRNNTGLRPIDIARSETVRAILRDPGPHIYLLEHNSDLITETL